MLEILKKLILSYVIDVEQMAFNEDVYYIGLAAILFMKGLLTIIIVSYTLSFLTFLYKRKFFNNRIFGKVSFVFPKFLRIFIITLNFLYFLRWHIRHNCYPTESMICNLHPVAEKSKAFAEIINANLAEYHTTGFVYEWHLRDFSFAKYFVDDSLITLVKENYVLTFGLDPMSESFLMLVSVIFGLVFLYVSPKRDDYFFYLASLVLIEFGLVLAFFTRDLFVYYIAFELTVIPMFYLIGKQGLQPNKIRANYYFIGYTLLGSIFLLYGIILLYTCIPELFLSGYCPKGHVIKLMTEKLTSDQQISIFVCLFIGFAIKVPLFPLYNWLPEAHVEAPTECSVILAALLLKLGGYGIYRFLFHDFVSVMTILSPFLAVIFAISAVNASVLAFFQQDVKRIIAYSSIAHMSMAMAGLFTTSFVGTAGFIVNSVSHGFVSAGLFFCVGCLYRHFGQRDISYFAGIDFIFRDFSSFFIFFNIANAGFPLMSSFIAEFLVFLPLWEATSLVCIFLGVSFILTIGYTYYLYSSICLGNLSKFMLKIKIYKSGLTDQELAVLTLLVVGVLWIGLYPDVLFFF
jgi:NADH-quinone oxidoreductase subunit M